MREMGETRGSMEWPGRVLAFGAAVPLLSATRTFKCNLPTTSTQTYSSVWNGKEPNERVKIDHEVRHYGNRERVIPVELAFIAAVWSVFAANR